MKLTPDKIREIVGNYHLRETLADYDVPAHALELLDDMITEMISFTYMSIDDLAYEIVRAKAETCNPREYKISMIKTLFESSAEGLKECRDAINRALVRFYTVEIDSVKYSMYS
jgi:hypothetical protein